MSRKHFLNLLEFDIKIRKKKNRNLYGHTPILNFKIGDAKFRILERETFVGLSSDPDLCHINGRRYTVYDIIDARRQ